MMVLNICLNVPNDYWQLDVYKKQVLNRFMESLEEINNNVISNTTILKINFFKLLGSLSFSDIFISDKKLARNIFTKILTL